ncbi:MAG: hypothetical protein J2P57_13185 [Acidimicrobiaceae bacterium]|nr:hypothetical protein [Acidimicrobiaceae bacterium]
MVTVDTEAIRTLAARFETASIGLEQQASTLRAEANLSPNAFGRLPAGQQTFAEYDERLQRAVAGLRQVEACLRQFAGNLRTVAANWERADEDSRAG